ncbi:MAG: chloride channel protein [Planctomycetales bacterium]|nr:chloride channel protein [Planctomycetales bacterium]
MPTPASPQSTAFARQVKQMLERFGSHLGGSARSTGTSTILLAGTVGILAGCGAAFFTWLIEAITAGTLGRVLAGSMEGWPRLGTLLMIPAFGLVAVSWFTRRFAPEAQGHGVPEVITAVARNDGVIQPRVALVKILASGFCIGTGGSVGREGPIVQIGSALGSTAGQLFKLSPRNIKVLVAAGAAAGISATFNAPLAGVMFASEIILGNFAVESLTPIVIASVLADVVQQHIGEHRFEPAFLHLHYDFAGAWQQLPSYLMLGLLAGLAAAGFIKLLYRTEDVTASWLPHWWQRALVLGGLVGLCGALYPSIPPVRSEASQEAASHSLVIPPLLGVGYGVVDHTLHLDVVNEHQPAQESIAETTKELLGKFLSQGASKAVLVDGEKMWAELWWLLPLVLLKPLMTSLTLAGGGSGGIFAPSLYLGATLGASVGLMVNMLFPQYSNAPGVYAIVGMGAVVAGTTHGVLSAILIVYEMTSNYQVILPIMAAAGVASLVSRAIEPESIYYKKLHRRGGSIARGHDLHRLDHIMVRDVMIREFPMLKRSDNVLEIVRVARTNSHIESLPVMGDDGRLIGIIRPSDLHRVLDSDISPHLVNAEDIALRSSVSVSPSENLIEALRDFGTRDVETLPVEVGTGSNRRLIGLLLRSDVMRRYRQEILAKH